jgi:hypothetical protein
MFLMLDLDFIKGGARLSPVGLRLQVERDDVCSPGLSSTVDYE